jgi:hydroxymethylpyrimidine pyrophosphatase-like HAD family hydrolase
LKRVADAVTATNEEDGVARAIAQHLLADAS